MCKEGMISLVNAKEVISTSGKDIILLVTGRKQLASGKERREPTPGGSDAELPDAELPRRGATQTQSYPDAKLPRVTNLHDFSANLSQSRIESEAELNHHGDVRTSHITDQSNSKYFEV